MPTAYRTPLESLPVSALRDIQATVVTAQRWTRALPAAVAAHPMPTAPRWPLGNGRVLAGMATQEMGSCARK